MSIDRPAPDRVPVLTEVIVVDVPDDGDAVALPEALRPAAPVVAPVPDLSDVVTASLTPPARVGQPASDPPLDQTTAPDASDLAGAIARAVELHLEARLREALAPALARAADTLIREARDDVALTVREMVESAVARELARRRGEG